MGLIAALSVGTLLFGGCASAGTTLPLGEPCPVAPLPGRALVAADGLGNHEQLVIVGADRSGEYGKAAWARYERNAEGRWRRPDAHTVDRGGEGIFEGVATSANGEWVAVGASQSRAPMATGLGGDDGLVAVISPTGELRQTLVLGGAFEDGFSDALPRPSGEVWAFGQTRSKGDAKGTSAWRVTLSPPRAGDAAAGDWTVAREQTVGNDHAQGFSAGISIRRGGVMVLGWRQAGPAGERSPWLARFSENGEVLATYQPQVAAGAFASAIVEVGESERAAAYILAGRRGSRAWVAWIRDDGTLQAQRDIGPPDAGQALTSVLPTTSGGALVGGTVLRYQRGLAGFFVLATGRRQTRWGRLGRAGLPLHLVGWSDQTDYRYVGATARDGQYLLHTFALNAQGNRTDCR